MKRLRTAAMAGFAAVVLGIVPGSAGAAQITGISDQHIDKWPAIANVMSSAFGSRFQQARYIVRWDVANLGPGHWEWQETDRVLNAARVKGKRILVSFNQTWPCDYQPGQPCTPRSFPSVADYKTAVENFRQAWPFVTEFTAWNEPNHPVSSYEWTGSARVGPLVRANPYDNATSAPTGAYRAADYYATLHNECRRVVAGNTCIVAAGDFNDTNTNPYISNYQARLSAHGLSPSVWAMHPYSAVNTGSYGELNAFLASIGTARSWFTEIGAKFCNGRVADPNNQALSGATLVWLMNTTARLDRTYYYELVNTTPDPVGNCGSADPRWDTGLIANQSVNSEPFLRTPLRTLFRHRSMAWCFRNSLSSGECDRGTSGSVNSDIPFAGDWDNNGTDSIGVFDPFTGSWCLFNSNSVGTICDVGIGFGGSGSYPVTGDWNGDGWDTIGVFYSTTGTWCIRHSHTGGPCDSTWQWGGNANIPISGDWNGDGIDGIGVFDPPSGNFCLRDSATPGPCEYGFTIPGAGQQDLPIVGDWDGDGRDSVGTFYQAGGGWCLRNSLSTGGCDPISFGPWGGAANGDLPVVGDWDGDGRDDPGVRGNA